MPFKSQYEYDQMMKNNPEKAKTYERHAKAKGLPVVSKKNTGYNASAMRRRMKKLNASGTQTDQEKELIKKRKYGY